MLHENSLCKNGYFRSNDYCPYMRKQSLLLKAIYEAKLLIALLDEGIGD